MAHESFEDAATAALMNELYINIKVDREERPDLDRLYQLAQQMLTGRGGGWPLTMFLMHDDQRPFFGGTYFPREARFGLPAFRDLLRTGRQPTTTSTSTSCGRRRPRSSRRSQDLNPAPAAAAALTAEPLSRMPRAARAELRRRIRRLWCGAEVSASRPDWRGCCATGTRARVTSAPDLQALYMAS